MSKSNIYTSVIVCHQIAQGNLQRRSCCDIELEQHRLTASRPLALVQRAKRQIGLNCVEKLKSIYGAKLPVQAVGCDRVVARKGQGDETRICCQIREAQWAGGTAEIESNAAS